MRATRLRSPCLVWLLLAAMVAAQWLGLAHGVLHARAALPPAGAAQRALPAAPVVQRHAWLGDLFGVHDHAGDCRLYDQLASGNPAPTLALPGLPSACAVQLPPRWVQRIWAQAPAPVFQARAPPVQG